jgi:hypothetical protein
MFLCDRQCQWASQYAKLAVRLWAEDFLGRFSATRSNPPPIDDVNLLSNPESDSATDVNCQHGRLPSHFFRSCRYRHFFHVCPTHGRQGGGVALRCLGRWRASNPAKERKTWSFPYHNTSHICNLSIIQRSQSEWRRQIPAIQLQSGLKKSGFRLFL